MEDTFEYKGCHAKIEYSEEDETFIGSVVGIDDTLAFDGKNIYELDKMFREIIDDYLELCGFIGKTPDE